MPCFGHTAVVFQSSHGTGHQISWRTADEEFLPKRWSFLFPDTCLTWRGLSEPYFSKRSQHFLHRVSPGLCAYLRYQRIRVLRDATQLWYNCHNSHSILVVAFSFFVGIVAVLGLFAWLFINLMMREQTLITGFAPRFCIEKLTLGMWEMYCKCTCVDDLFWSAQ